jgi:hypothetical protein
MSVGVAVTMLWKGHWVVCRPGLERVVEKRRESLTLGGIGEFLVIVWQRGLCRNVPCYLGDLAALIPCVAVC